MAVWKNLITKATSTLKINKARVTQVTEFYSDNRIRDILTPVTATVTGVVQKGYDVSRQVDGAVRTQARVIHDYFSDDQIRQLLSRNLKFLVQNSALFVARSYGGGPIIDIVSASLQDQNAASQKERLKELENKVAKLEKALCSREFRVEADIYMARTNSHDKLHMRTHINLNPEEILQVVLMKHLGLKIIDDFVMAKARSKTDLKPAFKLIGSPAA
ncbi:uncharacterized protein LOC110724879 [Chenopodium quinoa]|uniref:Uncharacterized protein n=1 Tax=Chenopodium quinoa TaxID=63459 RepID=A0A803LKR9_CHEQI|nr:uncharacterized protein LOC110724879 [Chenopodium quinoa]